MDLHNEALNRANAAFTEKKLDQDRADLIRRVEDWKGHSIHNFGPLLFSDTVQCRPGTPRATEAEVWTLFRLLTAGLHKYSLKRTFSKRFFSFANRPLEAESIVLVSQPFASKAVYI